jgi:ABC-2 type transport system permease protein
MKWGIKAMQSKTFWFNKEIILQGFRSAGWLGIIYFLALFFALPLRIVMLISEEERRYHIYFDVKNLFSWNGELLTVLSVTVPVLVAIFIFRYLQMKASSDLFHSLPVKRNYLFYHFIGIGSFLVIVPVILNMVILLFMHPALGLSEFFTIQSILYWTGVTIIINLLVFMASVFVGMLTGISIVQGILSYVFLLLPVGLCLLLSFSLELFVYGFSFDYYTGKGMENLSPLTRIIMIRDHTFSQIEAWVYLGISILLVVLSIFIYQKRKLEAVSNPIVFPFLRPIFKYGVTFCFMLLGGSYFGEVQNSLGWTIFGYVIGSIIGYLVAEMVLQKTWRVLGSARGYMSFVLATAALYLIIQFDVSGYERRIPELEEVERIHYSGFSYSYLGKHEEPVQFFYENENMDRIIKLHRKIIEDKAENEGNINNDKKVFFAYELKNGRKLIREYIIPLNNEYDAYLKPIYESLEYKKVRYRAMQLQPSELEQITFMPSGIGPMDREVTFTDQSDINELLSILKKDIQNEKYEEMVDGTGVISRMEFTLKKHDPHYETSHSIKASYSLIEEWLKEKGKYKEGVLTGEDFDYTLVIKDDTLIVDEYYSLSNDAMIEKLNNLENTIKIINKEDVLLAWKNSYSDHYKEGYKIVFFFKEKHHIEFRGISEKNVNSLIKN